MPASHSNGPPTNTLRHPASWASPNGNDTLLGSLWISGPRSYLVWSFKWVLRFSDSKDSDSKRLFCNVIPRCQPIVIKSRRFNNDDQQCIHNEVSKLLNDDIIEPPYSPWRAPVVVTKDERHKRRMIVDYSQTINKFTLLDAYPLPNIDEQVSEIAKGTVFSTLDLKSAYYQLPLCPEDRPYTAFEACGKLY